MSILKSSWSLVAVGAFVVAAVMVSFLLTARIPDWLSTVLAAALGGGIASAIVYTAALIDRRTRVLNKLIRAGTAETRAMTNIRPLFDERPVNVDGWALSAEASERVVHEVMTRRPALIVECGSGTSTLLMATCLREFEIDGQIISIDHDSTYAQATRDLLDQRGVADRATVVTAPLASRTIDGQSVQWYDLNPEDHLNTKIDFLLVDGPPNPLGSMIRFPAVPIFQKYLSTDALILLDDGQRQDERKVAKAWANDFEFDTSLEGSWCPYWVVRPPSS
jgi:predicted O-methyltransferase YrrM